MPRTTIIGGGQSGLQLAIGLLQAGHEVTVVSDRSPEQIHDGRVTSSQCMFANALDHERALGIDFWADTCPPVEGISFTVPHPEIPGEKALEFASRLDRIAQAVDQRIKFPRWMEHFEGTGGRLVTHEASVDDLERYAQESDLVVVAAGKGEIARFFERDAERAQFDQPMRALALTYVTGMTPRPEYSAVCFNLCPGVGEYFVFPAETIGGACEIMVFEGVPGGPMDCWDDVTTPDEHLAKSRWILDTFFPWEGERCRSVELTDPLGVLTGRFPPTVRKPVGTLPSGRQILGMADAVVLNDPITGQGSNNAAKAAAVYLRRIVERGDGPFDAAWMQETFEESWAYAKDVVGWTNALLLPPPPHVLELLGAACANPTIAHRFVNGFDDPRDYWSWFMTPDAAQAYLAELGTAA
ncbi:MAG: FAD-binding oxidoreductase [Actinobacteria bacterium]|nr:FAD-binding oxidoreductase [Actinomycetota bacterium]